jgi:hypothetical protein
MRGPDLDELADAMRVKGSHRRRWIYGICRATPASLEFRKLAASPSTRLGRVVDTGEVAME